MTTKFITHYVPFPKGSQRARSTRVAICGVSTEIGNEERAGSSDLEHVDCPECLNKSFSYEVLVYADDPETGIRRYVCGAVFDSTSGLRVAREQADLFLANDVSRTLVEIIVVLNCPVCGGSGQVFRRTRATKRYPNGRPVPHSAHRCEECGGGGASANLYHETVRRDETTISPLGVAS